MNTGTSFAAGASITAMLAGFLMWITHWPLQPMDNTTATDCAGLLIAIFGGGGLASFSIRAAAKAAKSEAERLSTERGAPAAQEH